jgi:hypothetical protein
MPPAELIFEDKQLLEGRFRLSRCVFGVFPGRFRRPRTCSSTRYSMGGPANGSFCSITSAAKGDHSHIGGVERAYRFENPEQLIEDFKAAVRAAREAGL